MSRPQRIERANPTTDAVSPQQFARRASAPADPAGETPLDYMLRLMRDPSVDDDRRDGMAKAALPYMHARLSSIDGPNADNDGGMITFTWQPIQN
jgi:hypothetical protein